MRNKLLIALGVVVALVLVFVAVVAMQPATYHIERTAELKAEPALIFAFVNNLERRRQWSPWESRDPDMTVSYNGGQEGVGAEYEWQGNDQVGHGKMKIVESEPPNRVAMSLMFIEPWQSEARTSIEIQPKGEVSEVTWSMDGDNDFMGKMMGMMMDLDALVGTDYEQGLGNLKKLVEEYPALSLNIDKEGSKVTLKGYESPAGTLKKTASGLFANPDGPLEVQVELEEHVLADPGLAVQVARLAKGLADVDRASLSYNGEQWKAVLKLPKDPAEKERQAMIELWKSLGVSDTQIAVD